VGHTVPETDYSLGESAALVNVVRGTTSSHITEVANPIPLYYACPSGHLTHVHWSGWSMGCNQLISVCKTLPDWILVVIPVLTMPSAASCPWGARVWLCCRPRSA